MNNRISLDFYQYCITPKLLLVLCMYVIYEKRYWHFYYFFPLNLL